MLNSRVADYDDFAWFYNRYWNEEFHSLAFPALERICLARIPAAARILDLCCGTGYLAGLLVARGFQVAGVDASPAMIEFARQNVPDAKFHIADASAFQLAGGFDAAVCTFDSLNHILRIEDLEAAFRNAAAVLKTGAPFAFDMLMEQAYQTHWGESFVLVRDDHVLTVTGAGYDFRDRIASCMITMFRLVDGIWRRSDTVIRERCYGHEEIHGALASAGFGDIESYEANALGMAGQIGAGRRFFVATECASRRPDSKGSGAAAWNAGAPRARSCGAKRPSYDR
jgi:SAM-dependent methyltransferase